MLLRLMTVYLSVSLLAGSMGVSVFRHTCHLFGVSETTFFEAKHCCDDASDDSGLTVGLDCCSVTVDYQELSVQSTEVTNDVKIVMAAVLPVFTGIEYGSLSVDSPDFLLPENHAPPLVRDLPVLFQSFLI